MSLPTDFVSFSPTTNPDSIVVSGNARFTVLTNRLIRMELDPTEKFEDRPSQVFWYRNQPAPDFYVKKDQEWLYIETDSLLLKHKINGRFHWRDLQVYIKALGTTWRYGDLNMSNLSGTTRTLDGVDGAIPLDDGIIARNGWSIVDDSNSLVFDRDGWLTLRGKPSSTKDIYLFGYAHDYHAAIKDYQKISGKPGLLPRWAFGNWWSRYWNYSDQDLINLIQDFQANQIPLSVCIVDMDWHITRTNNKSSGWTGYTWNKNLFPDPEFFIQTIHDMGLKTALNLHPAEGVHPHEQAYPAFAASLGIDPASKQPIDFDLTSKIFTDSYFELLHHPQENIGIDFWWIDWQQGTKTKTEGLDPLFWLNHLHYYDLGRKQEKRPFIFSRWPGLGGHRYPIGFSGDTIVSWNSLAFQPKMTANAANVAYGWWSHDIGGHTEGMEDPELYLRWVQFGVFSPIFRLHSTNNPFIDRRPWGFNSEILKHARSAMQLRHKLVPMLYSANHLNATTGEPPILPMYYNWPEEESAYQCPQQYQFCRQLIVAPVVTPLNPETNLSRQVVWLPRGKWFNFFSGEFFPGGAWYSVYNQLSDIPVFASSGSIIPLSDEINKNGVENPENITVKIFVDAQSEFSLYEDDGQTQAYRDGQFVTTQLSQILEGQLLTIKKSASIGLQSLIPNHRSWSFQLFGLSKPTKITVQSMGKESQLDFSYDDEKHLLELPSQVCSNQQDLLIQLQGVELLRQPDNPIKKISRLIKLARVPSLEKNRFIQKLPDLIEHKANLYDLYQVFTNSQLLALYECIFPSTTEGILLNEQEAFYKMTKRMLEFLN